MFYALSNWWDRFNENRSKFSMRTNQSSCIVPPWLDTWWPVCVCVWMFHYIHKNDKSLEIWFKNCFFFSFCLVHRLNWGQKLRAKILIWLKSISMKCADASEMSVSPLLVFLFLSRDQVSVMHRATRGTRGLWLIFIPFLFLFLFFVTFVVIVGFSICALCGVCHVQNVVLLFSCYFSVYAMHSMVSACVVCDSWILRIYTQRVT